MRKLYVAGLLITTVALLVALGYVISGFSAAMASASAQPGVGNVGASSPAELAPASDLEAKYENIYAQTSPSVVAIDTVQDQSQLAPGAGLGQSGQPSLHALGSGFVWNNQGYIVTNNHVVANATRLSVTFSDGTTLDGKVVGADPGSDLAVLQVNRPAGELHPVALANSDQVKVGQLAVAIGNPFGEQNTMTSGIVSAVGRSLPVGSADSPGPTFSIPDVIQTDAPINPGNSGGVLLNDQGQVIGVTTAIESPAGTSAGIGFAIPSSLLQKVIPALITSGHYDHPYIGISGMTMTPDVAQAMGLQSGQRGVLVVDVTPGSPAEHAGIHGSTTQATIDGVPALVGGDVIVALNGQPIQAFDDISSYLARSGAVNQTATLSVLRGGKEQTVKITLAVRSSAQTGQ
ncbi:MAG: trypsin-like peptidase domain-containing protein [Chloroflexi bacterium]|nr:trypsin-like peptidase domain-containing protein [Chloroflexota bacterium]